MTQGAANVLIVGAGLGGITLGCTLARAGIPFQILERAPIPSALPAGMLLAGNGFEALTRAGLAEGLADKGNVFTRAVFYGPDEQVMAEVPLGLFSELYGSEVLSLSIRTLLDHLLAQLPEGAIRWGTDIRDVTLTEDGASAHASNGEVYEGTVLVGADGARSRISQTLAIAPEPLVLDVISYRGLTLSPGLPNPESLGIWIDEQLQFGAMEVGGGQAGWWAMVRSVAGDSSHRLRTPEAVAELVPEAEAWMRDLICSTSPSRFRRTRISVREPTADWGRGPVTLLGDAAHAMAPGLGQGGSQAIIDAVVLGDLLATSGLGPSALRDYERQRSRDVRFMALQARHALEATLIDRAGIEVARRNLARLLPSREGDREGRMLHSFRGRRGGGRG